MANNEKEKLAVVVAVLVWSQKDKQWMAKANPLYLVETEDTEFVATFFKLLCKKAIKLLKCHVGARMSTH